MARSNKKTVAEYFIIAFLAFCMATAYELFVFPNAFAPAGINGLATIIQHLFNFSVGYMSIIINIPLLIVAYFKVSKDFAFKTLCYVIVFSITTLIEYTGMGDSEGFLDLSGFAYKNDTISAILAPLASGAINGLIYGYLVRKNTCTGGTDIVARLVRVKRPELNIMWVTLALNSIVAFLSYFAYAENGEYDIQPVLLCFMYCFTSSKMGDLVLKGYKTALKFEVVTSHPDEISQEIIQKLRHSATVVHGKGMYTHQDKDLLICVINKNQIVDFENIIVKYPGTFAYITSVSETVGNFVTAKKSKNKEEN
ncbi:MAG: YitT family protein [Clostridiales bacterium]|nr:YitT family protein [Clostridiales bacterium]